MSVSPSAPTSSTRPKKRNLDDAATSSKPTKKAKDTSVSTGILRLDFATVDSLTSTSTRQKQLRKCGVQVENVPILEPSLGSLAGYLCFPDTDSIHDFLFKSRFGKHLENFRTKRIKLFRRRGFLVFKLRTIRALLVISSLKKEKQLLATLLDHFDLETCDFNEAWHEDMKRDPRFQGDYHIWAWTYAAFVLAFLIEIRDEFGNGSASVPTKRADLGVTAEDIHRLELAINAHNEHYLTKDTPPKNKPAIQPRFIDDEKPDSLFTKIAAEMEKSRNKSTEAPVLNNMQPPEKVPAALPQQSIASTDTHASANPASNPQVDNVMLSTASEATQLIAPAIAPSLPLQPLQTDVKPEKTAPQHGLADVQVKQEPDANGSDGGPLNISINTSINISDPKKVNNFKMSFKSELMIE